MPQWVVIAFSVNPITALASFMFTYGFIYVLISSFLLFIAVVGAIYLTLIRGAKSKVQDDYIQLLRETRLNAIFAQK